MKKDNFKNIIKDNLKEQSPDALTQKVMQAISTEVCEVELRTLLKDDLIYKAPGNFTSSVLESLIQESSVKYSPVISKKVWYFIGAVFIAIFALGLNDTSLAATDVSYMAPALEFINIQFKVFISFFFSNTFLMLLIVSISSLVMLDTLIRSNKFDFNKV